MSKKSQCFQDIFPKLMHRFNTMLIKIPASYFMDMDKKILKFIWNGKGGGGACVVSPVRLFAILWTVDSQASLSMEFSRQEYWSGLPFPTPGDLLEPGSNPGLLHCRWFLYCLNHQYILNDYFLNRIFFVCFLLSILKVFITDNLNIIKYN